MEDNGKFFVIDGVKKFYPHKDGKIHLTNASRKQVKAVDDINLSIERGEVLGIIGESGCGKSTLGRVLARLEDPTEGDVFIDGVSTGEVLKKDPKAFRRMVQIIFQNPFDTFTPRDTIRKILLRPLKHHNIGKNTEERLEICRKALEAGGLVPADDILGRYPHELSGGQLQRISIIRSMFLDPSIIIADEPVSMLDVSVRAEIIAMLLKLAKEKNAAVIFISHDIALTRYVSDNVAVMYLGRVVEYGKTDEVISNPQHPYTRALLSNCASVDPFEQREEISIEGEPPTPIDPGPGCYFAPRCFCCCEKCKKAYPEIRDVGNGHLVSCFRTDKQDG